MKPSMLFDQPTPDQVGQYIKNADHTPACLFCGAHQSSLSYDSTDVEGSTVYQTVYCSECEKSWTDAYELERIIYNDGETFYPPHGPAPLLKPLVNLLKVFTEGRNYETQNPYTRPEVKAALQRIKEVAELDCDWMDVLKEVE